MRMTVFLTKLDGTPAPAVELAAITWWPDNTALTLAPAVRGHLLPALRAANRVRAWTARSRRRPTTPRR